MVAAIEEFNIIFYCWSTRKQACVYRIFIAIVFLYTIVIITLMLRGGDELTVLCVWNGSMFV